MADFDLTTVEQNAVTVLPKFNVRPYNTDASSPAFNPYGFDNGGYLVHQMVQADMSRVMGLLALRMAVLARADVALTHADVLLTKEDARNTGLDRIAAAQSVLAAAGKVTDAAAEVAKASVEVGRAKAEADRAQGYAAAVNLPSIGVGEGGMVLTAKADRSGFELKSAQPPAGSVTEAMLAPSVASTITTLRKDLLLTALQAAAASGDAMRLSGGFIDPYSDISDVTLSDAAFSSTGKLVSIGLGAIPISVGSVSNPNGSLPTFVTGSESVGLGTYLFSDNTPGCYATGSGAGQYLIVDRGSDLRSVSTVEVVCSGPVGASFAIGDQETPGIWSSVRGYTITATGLRLVILDFSASPLQQRYVRVQINDVNGGQISFRAIRLRGPRRALYAVPAPTSCRLFGQGVNLQNPPHNAELIQQSYSGLSGAYLEVDFAAPVRLQEIVFYNFGGYDTTYYWSSIEGSNDKVSWSVIGSRQSVYSGYGQAGVGTLNVSSPGSYRYYRAATQFGNFPLAGVGFAVQGAGTPSLLSSLQVASVQPSSARVGAQIKLLNGAALADFVAEASRNNGGNWTPVPLSKLADQFDGFGFYEGTADLSAQPAGSAMRYRLRSLNDARFDVGGALMQWG